MAMETEFGTLRSMFQGERDVDADTLIPFLRGARKRAPQEYDEQWLAYLTQLSLPKIEADSITEFFGYCKLLPAHHPMRLHVMGERGPVLERLLDSEHLPRLSCLLLYQCDLADAGLARLLDADRLSRLETLWIRECQITDEGAETLCRSQVSHQLRVLALYNHESGITPRTCAALAQATHMTRLEELDLAWSALGDEGVTALTRAPHFDGLTELVLSWTGLTDRACAMLATCGHLGRLAYLELEGNDITSQGVDALARSRTLPSSLYATFLENPCAENDDIIALQGRERVYHYVSSWE